MSSRFLIKNKIFFYSANAIKKYEFFNKNY